MSGQADKFREHPGRPAERGGGGARVAGIVGIIIGALMVSAASPRGSA